MRKIGFGIAVAAAAMSTSTASAANIFGDGLDSLANFVVSPLNDATAQIVDYSSFSVPNPLASPVIRSHPEAPRMVAGSGATTGVLFTANDSGGAGLTGAATGVTITSIAQFSGTYQFSFDMYLSVGNGVTEFFPESGSTEDGTAAVGRQNTTSTNGWSGRATGDGVNTWIAVENGFGSADVGLWNDNVEISRRGDTANGGVDAPLWNDAFPDGDNFGVNQTPANTWVQGDIAVEDQGDGNSRVRVFWNGVNFFDAVVANADVAGAISVGYEDPFSSISSQPDFQYGLFDNIVVSDTVTIPEPASLALIGLGGLTMLKRRR